MVEINPGYLILAIILLLSKDGLNSHLSVENKKTSTEEGVSHPTDVSSIWRDEYQPINSDIQLISDSQIQQNLQDDEKSYYSELSKSVNRSSIYSPSSDCSTKKSPKVFTKWATIEGFSRNLLGNCVDHFLGIPYAEPPVGNLRYAFPVPMKGKYRGEVYSAKSFGSPCKQGLGPRLSIQPSSEDCLYLNVYRPSDSSPNNLKPVMLFIYGGRYISGSTSQSFFYGGYFTSITDIVVVTFNYRLGAFGFLSGGGSLIPGNQGYMDFELAATWVKENIKDFGGDPGRITVAGQSSGSGLATLCLFSEKCSKLFDRFILASPGFNAATYFDSPEVCLRKSKSLSRQVGCGGFSISEYYLSTNEIECLLMQDPNVIAQQSIMIQETDGNGICAKKELLPCYGNQIFPDSIQTMLYEKRFAERKSILFGKVSTELTQALLAQGFSSKSQAATFLSKVGLPKSRDRSTKNVASLLSYYLGDSAEDNLHSLGEAASRAITDLCHHCLGFELAETLSKFNRVFYYSYDYVPVSEISSPYHIYGAFHADDVRLLFGEAYMHPELFTDYDREVTLKLLKIYGDFIRGDEVKWPKWQVINDTNGRKVNYPYIVISQGGRVFNGVGMMEDSVACPRLNTLSNIHSSQYRIANQ